MSHPDQGDMCTCGHLRATHFEEKSKECSVGSCICAEFDKVDPVRAAAPKMLVALGLAHREFVGLAAYLETCAPDVIAANLPSLIASLNRTKEAVEAAIREAESR
jgi:hypothetical protein